MTKTFLAFLSLTFALLLSGASGIASDSAAPDAVPVPSHSAGSREKNLALFIDALLEKNPEVQCKKLLDVVAADPANAATPLRAFYSSFKKVRNRKALLVQFNSIWEKNPDNFFLAAHGPDLNKACGTPAKKRLEQLKSLNSKAPAALSGSPQWTRDLTATLLRSTARCYMELRQYDKLVPLFEKWNKTSPEHRLALYVTLGNYCYTAAARSYCSGNFKLGKKLDHCFALTLKGLKELEPHINDNKGVWSILLYYTSFRKLIGNEAVRYAQNFYQRTPTQNANVWRLGVAVDCGDLDVLNDAVREVNKVNSRFNAAELRFKANLNAGKFSDAEKELSNIPFNRQVDLRRELYSKQKAWDKLVRFVNDRLSKGAPADASSGIMLLTAAEHLASPSLYRQAVKILTPSLNIPGVANAVGYIGAVLGLDLNYCRQLLEAALKKEPGNYAYLDSMAWICFKQKRYADAEKWIRKALANATPREGMAVILDHTGDIAAAQGKNPRVWYELAIKYAPFDDECDTAAIKRKLKALK